MQHDDTRREGRNSLRRLVLIGLVIFLLLVAAVLILAWTTGDAWLPMQYEGFD